MSEHNYSLRRYQLPQYNKKDLASEIKTWVKQRNGRIYFNDDQRLFRHYTATFYAIATKGKSPLILGGIDINFHVCYDNSVLYVYIIEESFPKNFQDIHEAVIIPYVKHHGGFPLDEAPRVLDWDLLKSYKRNLNQALHDLVRKVLEKEGMSADSLLFKSSYQTTPKVDNIHLEAETETVQATSEEVSVPPGVTIKIKRSRTIEHTVDIDWQISGSGNIEAGFKPIISASIRGEIGHKQGHAYNESETMEYEIDLNGETNTCYRLIWTDIWRKGFAEFQIGNATQTFPFRFREWTKLDVSPTVKTE